MERRAPHSSFALRRWTLFALAVAASGTAGALQYEPRSGRFDPLVVVDPALALDVATTPIESLAASESLRAAWDGFRAEHGASWKVYLDRRSGAPLLAEGSDFPWPVSASATVDSIADSVRAFLAKHESLCLADDKELVFVAEASGALSDDVWQIVFARAIAGVPVEGERYIFTIGHGNLMSFGASRWSRIDADPVPRIDARDALGALTSFMGLNAAAGVTTVDAGTLELIALRADPPGAAAGPYAGAVGSGYGSALVWRVALRVDGDPGTWEGLVDAATGAIRSFRDVNDYATAKGGVYPISNDGAPPDGIEQPDTPMPFVSVDLGAGGQPANSSGVFTCAPAGATATTMLDGPYIRTVDNCGPVSQSVVCDHDLQLGAGAGTDCVVPAGSSTGDTHAARTSFYQLNRIAEHARALLQYPSWPFYLLESHVNLNYTCNAFWDGGTVNFFKSGGGCRNSGELAGVILHEWGHGLDENDGGGKDSPGEAYADVTALMFTHSSCSGRGFRMTGTCSGYGDACLTCTGVRDLDWDQHASHTPATPQGFVAANCPAGSSTPCGKEAHCEGHVAAEAMWDLAVRDLPASGLDAVTSWQLADKLWYWSRLGSGGNAYNCSLPNSDGCGVTSWFKKLRTADDNDGNLGNGTPHAAAIFAAFNRHKIACGAAGDASNQSTGCPALGGTVLTASPTSSTAQLSWTPVSGAYRYNVLRSDLSCDAGFNVVGSPAGTSFIDTALPMDYTRYYRVQAVQNNSCDGPVSNCRVVTPKPLAGSVAFDAGAYACAGSIGVSVVDGNIDGATTTVKVTSPIEPAGETIVLTRQAPGSSTYTGSLIATSNPPSADGAISVANGATISAVYVDADDGVGGMNVTRKSTATIDCAGPVFSDVRAVDVTKSGARITWSTDEPATSTVHYGAVTPPGSTAALSTLTLPHSVQVAGLSSCSPYVYSVESADGLGNSAHDDASGAFYRFTTGRDTTQGLFSTDTPAGIPDFSTGTYSTIIVPDLGVIQGVVVTVNITHTFTGDLALYLNTPTNVQISLAQHRGTTANFTGTVFDDAAATSIAAGFPPFTGSFRPETPLSALVGTSSPGAWSLYVRDDVSGNSGRIDNWSLALTVPVACSGPPGGVHPVADGSFGTAMRGARANAAGSAIVVTWDVATCASADHHILYGDLASVASMTVTGASCDLGTSGMATWTGVPVGDLWFLVVGDDDIATEGSWGTDGSGAQRGGDTASGACGFSSRENSATCP
jgi:subtilisin-like proprotein convertase family protein